ncbi:ATP-grasp domain-containing protein [Streptomyces chrestomyceticus]|uniref:ATP-grasp domain-containing protein n=1 Tax=Streptomyces chrestomyceticus TaxID=68185 RepID=A0ABU7WPL0_9ACTN
MSDRPLVAVVDPFSTGSQLAAEFGHRGWDTAAVLSGTCVRDGSRRDYRREEYRAVIDMDRDGDPVGRLRALAPTHVITGSEWGVATADRLAEQLGLPGNGTALSLSRRDKFAMAERVREAGLPVAASLLATNAEDIVAWADRHGHWPVVLKPPASAGSDEVTFCADAERVRAAFARIHRRPNQMGGFNQAVLAQERLVGEQYFVNSVSRDGRHHLHEFWRERRAHRAGRVVYDTQDLLPARGTPQDELSAYVVGVLDALGIAHGPAHTEVMMTARGPVLVECGARLEGSVTSRGPLAATGHSQVSLTVDAYTAPERFAALPGTAYTLRRHLRVVCLIVPEDGYVAEAPLRAVRALPTYLCGSVDDLAPGTPVRATTDLFSSPGHLYLLGRTPREIERDYAAIRAAERDELYQRSPQKRH